MNRLVEFSENQYSLSDPSTGEPMHSRMGAIEEARLVYVEQCRLKERLLASDPAPLVIWDLGLGIAANSVAALECHQSLSKARPLQLFSVEKDLSGIQFAIEKIEFFPYLKPYESALKTLLGGGMFRSADQVWTLVHGSFPDIIPSLPAPEVVFYDFYSPRTNPELWEHAALSALYSACAPRIQLNQGTMIATYCAATHVRKKLASSGFHVGRGTATPVKRETTLASTLRAEIKQPLLFTA